MNSLYVVIKPSIPETMEVIIDHLVDLASQGIVDIFQ